MSEDKQFFQIYDNVSSSFKLYWSTYGGSLALVKSPYLHVSAAVSLLCYPLSSNVDKPWYDLPLSILPNLLGFTLRGYAILLAFGSDKFLMILAARKKDSVKTSTFMDINGAFAHFIVLQVACIVYSLICSAWQVSTGFYAFFGFTLFVYSIFSSLAATFSILRMGKWYDIYLRNKWELEKRRDSESHQDKW